MLLSCFGLDEKNNKMATILLANLTCTDCNSEVNKIIQSIEEIEYYELWINNGATIILLNIEGLGVINIKPNFESQFLTLDI